MSLNTSLRVLATLVACLSACKGTRRASPDGGETPRVALVSTSGIHWLRDNYESALAEAKKRRKPLVIDFWAPWCHTCLSMKHHVLRDVGLATFANRFVWVALDTDKAVNANVLPNYSLSVWPTFVVVDPDSEAVQARHMGAASLAQFRAFLLQGESGVLEARAKSGDLGPASPLRHLRAGDRAANAGNYANAEKSYAAALAATEKDWPRRPEVLLRQISVSHQLGNYKACATLVLLHAGDTATGSGPSAADFAYYGNECADRLQDKAQAKAVREKLADTLSALIQTSEHTLSVDDRSEALRVLRELHIGLDLPVQARALAEQQKSLLDSAAHAAHSPFAAMTYNWPRAEVYAFLGRAAELIADLQTSVANLPKQYDPPYRLAWIYLKSEQPDRALEQAHRALALVYGPRKALVQTLLAEIHQARGDHKAQKIAIEGLIKIYEDLPEGQKLPEREKKAREFMQSFETK